MMGGEPKYAVLCETCALFPNGVPYEGAIRDKHGWIVNCKMRFICGSISLKANEENEPKKDGDE